MNLRPTPPGTPEDSDDEPHFRGGDEDEPSSDDGRNERRVYVGAVGQVAVADPRRDAMDGGCFLCDTIGETGAPGTNEITNIFSKFMSEGGARDPRLLAHELYEAWRVFFYDPAMAVGDPISLYSEGNFLRHFTENHKPSRTMGFVLAMQDLMEIRTNLANDMRKDREQNGGYSIAYLKAYMQIHGGVVAACRVPLDQMGGTGADNAMRRALERNEQQLLPFIRPKKRARVEPPRGVLDQI